MEYEDSTCLKNISRLWGSERHDEDEVFISMFPPNQLTEMVRITNRELREKEEKPMTIGEMVKFMGLCIIITRFQFSLSRYLWSKIAPSKYVPAFKLGHLTGTTRNRFDTIWICLRWIHQPNQREEGMTHVQYIWLLVDNFIDRFNTHRSDKFLPGSTIGVDESMVRWYNHGGNCINRGLPHYITIERKP